MKTARVREEGRGERKESDERILKGGEREREREREGERLSN